MSSLPCLFRRIAIFAQTEKDIEMKENQKFDYEAPETVVFKVQSERCMVPSSWGHEEG